MAVDYFMKIEGVDGESKDADYKNWIDVLSWSWGVSNPSSGMRGGGAGGGRADFQSINCIKEIDKASPVLLKNSASGKHFSEAKLIARKAGGDSKVEYLKIKLKKVFVSDYSTGGSADGPIPTESVGLTYKEIKFEYTPQNDDGSAGASSEFGWKVDENQPA
ncbi:MAG: type VI secretion system tube protein Hcp [Xanthomonadales bacterium]|nr:type VI secretion system tube protein Hcp [Xanthomonadales bacterium]